MLKKLIFLNGQKVKKHLFVCFQETHSYINEEKLWEDEWGNLCIFSHFTNRSARVSIMLKKGLDFKIHNSHIYKNGRYIILDMNIHDQHLTLANVYGYNTDEPSFYHEILQKMPLITTLLL